MRNLCEWLRVAIVVFGCALPGSGQRNQTLLMEAVAPIYPMVAVYSATGGEVVVKLTIGKDGVVTAVKVMRGHKLLAASAQEAARRWRFVARDEETEVPVTFVFRILPKGTPDTELATRFRMPYQIEVRRIIPEASTNRDPAPDSPKHDAK